jgi:S-adenosylmethionine:tRNA ribosyltransferase-isomerase
MSPARWPTRQGPREQKLLVIERAELARPVARRLSDLADLLHRGDLLVLNDASTFPASLQAHALPGRERLEIRLLPKRGDHPWQAILFGAGDWRQRTEDRPPPPLLKPGTHLEFSPSFHARILKVSETSERLVELEFDIDIQELWKRLYALGKPVQYSYLRAPAPLWLFQTPFSGKPWASEMPSAGYALAWELILRLKAKGIEIASLTHSTGLSSTGDTSLDALLPLTERSEIPPWTVSRIREARARGGRVIAVGTSVVRALEGRARPDPNGELRPGAGETSLVLGPAHELRIVDGVLTGIHDVQESHFRLLEAFADRSRLEDGLRLAEREGFLTHEFGDSCLIA